jgi:hypothetical protein
MKKYIIVTMLSGLCLGGVLIFNYFTPSTTGQSYDNINHVKKLNDLAKTSNLTNTNEAEILLNEAFKVVTTNDSSILSNFPEIKSRIIRSELKYRNNQREGVSETNIAVVINNLAAQFNAPEYAKTNELEVRELRVTAARIMPNFVGRYRANEEDRVGSVNTEINPKMSPIESVFTVGVLIVQKRTSPYYQMSNAEKQADWVNLHKPNVIDNLPDNPARQAEMDRIVTNGISNMNLNAMKTAVNQVLDNLGIEQ